MLRSWAQKTCALQWRVVVFGSSDETGQPLYRCPQFKRDSALRVSIVLGVPVGNDISRVLHRFVGVVLPILLVCPRRLNTPRAHTGRFQFAGGTKPLAQRLCTETKSTPTRTRGHPAARFVCSRRPLFRAASAWRRLAPPLRRASRD